MRASAPLFRIDPGWLYIAAGLALFAAGILVPAQADLRQLTDQRDQLRDEEKVSYARLKAYADFLVAMDDEDPLLVRRLAAAQLNLMPRDETPVLQAASLNTPVKRWIEATVHVTPDADTSARRDSLLGRWAKGTDRLWLFAVAAMSMFIGLLLSAGGMARPRVAAADPSVTGDGAVALEVPPRPVTEDLAAQWIAGDSATTLVLVEDDDARFDESDDSAGNDCDAEDSTAVADAPDALAEDDDEEDDDEIIAAVAEDRAQDDMDEVSEDEMNMSLADPAAEIDHAVKTLSAVVTRGIAPASDDAAGRPRIESAAPMQSDEPAAAEPVAEPWRPEL